MIYVLVNKAKKNEPISTKARIANTFWLRFKGLMFRKDMDEEEALIFYHTPSIHMFFMRFPIDVIFLDKEMCVVKVCPDLKPWRLAASPRAYVTVELPAGTLGKTSVKIGDILALVNPKEA